MSENHSRKLSIHLSHYFVAQVIVLVGGLLTFPLLTRMLSKADYGILNLVNTAISLCVITSKLGLQNATVRFLPAAQKQGEGDETQIYATVVIVSLTVSSFLAISLYFFSPVIFPNFHLENRTFIVFCAATLIVIRSIYLCFLTFFRANQKAFQVSLYQIVNKYLAISMLCIMFFLYKATTTIFFAVLLCAESFVLIICIIAFIRQKEFNFRKYSTPFLKKAVKFGLPLLGFELIAEFLAYGDRYLIQYFLGAKELAVYSAGYNLADYARNLLLYPLAFAVTPIIMEIWEDKGQEATEKFATEALGNYWYILIPAIFGVSFLGGDIVVALASEKYAASYLIIPYVILGATIYGTFPLTGAGLFVTNRTKILFYLVSVAAVLNIFFNIYLIPRHGIVGAAEATLISYLILFIMVVFSSRKYLRVKLLNFSIVKAFAASLMMLLILFWLKQYLVVLENNKFIYLFFNVVIGISSYGMFVFAFDNKIRGLVVKKLRKWQNIV